LQSPSLPCFRNVVKVLPLPSPQFMLPEDTNGNTGNSDSLADPVELRLTLISTSCCPAQHLQGPPALPCMASPACHPCYPGRPTHQRQLKSRWAVPAFPRKLKGRHLQPNSNETTCGFAFATTCRLARHPQPMPLSGNSVPRVTPHTSLKLPGRTDNSQGGTLTHWSYSIHGIQFPDFY
jgi:hypothetical protein